MVALENLDRDALVRILREPKNSLAKQYRKLFALDHADLVITDDAFGAIADLAIRRETGARGLRSILEDIMMKPMYEVPSHPEIARVIIDAEYVEGKKETPIYEYRASAELDSLPASS